MMSYLWGLISLKQQQLTSCLQLLNKMISQEVQKFKQFMKLKLLNPYRDKDNFREMVAYISSSNVNNYHWESEEEKQRITERILFIEKLNFVLEEEKAEFQLNNIIDSTEVSYLINNEGFVQLLIEKNKNIKIDDFNGLHSKDQIKKIQQHLLKNKDFKKWCDKYSSNLATPAPSNHNHAPPHQSTTNGNTPTNDLFEQDYSRALMQANSLQTHTDFQKREMNRQRKQYLTSKVNELQKQYSQNVLQLKLINLELSLLKDPQYQIRVSELRKMLEEETRLNIEQLRQKFESYDVNGVRKIIEAEEVREISKYLTPIDTYKIKLAASNVITKQKAALMIIGDSGVGKSTLILRLSDYELKSQKINKIDTLVTTKPVKPEHKNLIASQSLQSVTQHLSAYQFTFKKFTIALIDSPGFNDTGGEEVDISNQISLQKAYENCDSICYLYLIDLIKLKGERCVMVVALAKNIASRFAYKTFEELESMLLLVFNKKVDFSGDLQLMNLPRSSVGLLKQCQYKVSDKQKMALKLISQRLNNQWSFFDPFREVEHIKSDIQRLTFKTPHRIMRKIDRNFENKVMQFNNILDKNIHYYLQARKIDVAKYHYDQLAILQKTIAQQSTKTRKKILDSWISREVTRIEDKIRQILTQKVSTLVAKNQQLEELGKLLTDVRPFTQILKLKETMDRINNQINNAFQTIVSFISNKATDEDISTVTRICGFFLNIDILKPVLAIKQKNIEKIYQQWLTKLPKQIKHKYKADSWQQFDASLKSYITYYKFYQSFSSTLPQQFSKIKQIKTPQEIKSQYIAKEQEKYKLFADSLSEVEQHFLHNSTISTQSIQKLNKHYDNALQFKQSIYISLASKIQQRQTSSKGNIDNKCIVYTQQFEKILQFKMSQSYSNSRNQVKSLVDNLYIIKNTLKIDSILSIINRTHEAIVKNVTNTAQQFFNKFKQAIDNINNLELKQNYKIFTFMKDKLSLLQIFEEAKNVTTSYQSFKKKIIEFNSILIESLKTQLKSNGSEATKVIFQRVKSLGRYERIDEQLDQLIHTSRSSFEQKVKTYMQDLKKRIAIKEIRSISDYKIFNGEYIKTMKSYIDGVLSYSNDESSLQSLHEQIYWINSKSLQNIDSLIDLCILCGKHQEQSQSRQETQNSGLLLKLREDFYFVKVLGQIYDNLRAINDKFLLYIKNELYSFKVSRSINIQEMIKKIEYFPQDRQQQMSSFLVTTNKFIVSSTNANGYKRIRIDKCTKFLQQTSTIKRLITMMIFTTQNSDFSKLAQQFVKIENELNILVATYNEKQMNRIQKAINIQTLVIPFMQQCQRLYNELKSGSVMINDTQNISGFIERLQMFVNRKVENYEKTLDSCEDYLGSENISNLNESIYYNQSFDRFIPKSDVLKYNISLFQKLDAVIKLISQQVEKAIENKLKMLEQKIQQRNFDHVDQELARLQKISNKMRDHFTHQINKQTKNGKTQQNLVVEHHQLTKIRTIIQKLESIRDLRLNQTKFDINIADHPFEGYNKFKLQEVYTHSKKGEVQHRIRQKIEQVFRQLLNKYQICQYSNSNKIGKEICDNLPYIPNELAKNYDYKTQYEILKDKKLKRERIELDKLKGKDIIANNNSLNKIITKYNEFSLNDNLQMKDQAFDLIKTELNFTVSEVIRAEDVATIIDIASQKFWSLTYKFTLNNEEISILELSSQFTKTEDSIVQRFAKIVTKSLNGLSSNVNNEQIAELTELDTQSIRKCTKNGYHFYTTFAEKKQKVHFDLRYKKIVEAIEQTMKDVAKSFDVVCPLDKIDEALNGEGLNAKKAKKLMKKCLIKSAIYSIIFSSFTSFDNPSINAHLNPSDMEIQPDSNSASITSKIKNFRDKIDNNIKYLKGQLLGIQFQNYAKQNESKEQIEALLLKADKQATLLEIYEQNLKSGRFGHDFEQTSFQSIVKSIQNKLNNFVSKFLDSLNDSINDLEKDIPNELYFLQMLLEKISTNCCRKIFDNLAAEEKESMGEESYIKFAINPTKEFNNYIETCLQKLRPMLKDARLSFCRVQEEQANLRKQLKQMQDKMQESLNTLYREYQKQLTSISQMNEGKSQDDIDHKLQEASTQFELDRQSQQKIWNDRGEALTKKHQDEIKPKQVQKNYASMLLNLKKLQFNFHSSNSAKIKLAEMIKTELDQVKKANALRLLSQNLDEYNCQNYAYLLKSNTPHFKYEEILQFNKKTQAQDIKYVTNQLKNLYFILEARYINSKDKINLTKVKDELFYEYNQFKKYYFGLLKENESELQNKIDIIIGKYKQADRILRLAIILAVWSLNEKSKNADSDIQLNNQEGQSLDINPHPVQVAALLLLTKTNAINEFCSQLVQILTGQGKSIVLAALAIYIAKTQVSVVVSCYSSYLCQRDLKNFQALFTKFKVNHLIAYNTFNEICEKVLNNPYQNTQKKITQVLMNKPLTGDKSIGATINKKSVLLIDEVDVFFEKQYFGSTYRPALKLNDKVSKDFIRFVFNQLEKDNKVMTNDLAKSQQFKRLIALYPRLEIILKNQLNRMKYEYLHPQNKYFIDQKMIKYKDKDKLSQKLHFGYETIFAYCRQYKNRKISPQNYEKSLFIPLIYGQFSYSELPKCYSAIIGLSGTIQHLPLEKINYLEKQYKIDKRNMYILPSIYGPQHAKVEAFTIQPEKTYYKYLIQKINVELARGRPVLVCFKNYTQLQKFNKSPTYIQSKLKSATLHEHLDNDLRDKCIMTVGTPNRLTVMTAEFSRGTDFIISDRKIKKNGGLHLILTYVPELRSQFIQFRGRTGRQGQEGSIHTIITETEAKEKGIACEYEDDILANFVKYMDRVSKNEDEQNKKKLEQSFKNHVQTQKYMQNISKSTEEYSLFLYNLNKCIIKKETPTKIVIGIDGTNSMQKTFVELINQMRIIMLRIVQIIKEGSMNGSFLVQIVVYRNYNSAQKILIASEFQENLQKLLPFLKKITVKGGMGNEAIQLLYRHINIQGDVDMVILIGDAPPNTESDVRENRKDEDWQKFAKNKLMKENPLYEMTNCNEEEKKFPQNIIINGLYINGNKFVEQNSAEKYFKDITNRHFGEAKELNFSKPDYSQNLVEFFTTKILAAVNGNENSEKINQLYRDKFRSYTT